MLSTYKFGERIFVKFEKGENVWTTRICVKNLRDGSVECVHEEDEKKFQDGQEYSSNIWKNHCRQMGFVVDRETPCPYKFGELIKVFNGPKGKIQHKIFVDMQDEEKVRCIDRIDNNGFTTVIWKHHKKVTGEMVIKL